VDCAGKVEIQNTARPIRTIAVEQVEVGAVCTVIQTGNERVILLFGGGITNFKLD